MLTLPARLIVIPLSYLRRLDSLRYTSLIALIAIGYLVIIVLAHYISGDTLQERGELSWVQWQGPIQALSSFPVIVFAYTCHQNVGYKIQLFKVSEEILILDSDVFYSE